MKPYDEVRDAQGAMRRHYHAFESRTNVAVTEPSSLLLQQLRTPGVVGSEGVHPVPLVLDERDYRDTLVAGVLQRAYALQGLFADIVFGTNAIVENGLLTDDELELILRSQGILRQAIRNSWRKQDKEQIRFVYGPDIVRDPGGSWLVIEDNIGCVGGVASGRVVFDSYMSAAGVRSHGAVPTSSGLEAAMAAFLRDADIGIDGGDVYAIPGVPAAPDDSRYGYETKWKGEALQALGAIVTQPTELAKLKPSAVSAIINLSGTSDKDYVNVVEAIGRERDIPIFGAPYVGVTASKSFHALGDAIVGLYLHEESILRAPATVLLREPLATLPDSGVLKRSGGCQGSEVFFLEERRHASERRRILEAAASWGPCGGVLQDHVPRSILPAAHGSPARTAYVEIRPIVYVYGWRRALVADIVTGRASVGEHQLHGNISRGAQFLPVIREPT